MRPSPPSKWIGKYVEKKSKKTNESLLINKWKEYKIWDKEVPFQGLSFSILLKAYLHGQGILGILWSDAQLWIF